jgi:pilus assembly protein Flp/PilA
VQLFGIQPLLSRYSRSTPISKIVQRFWTDDSGQDIIEYALLTALIGLAAIVSWQLLANKVGPAYSAADSNVQGLAAPPDPIVR